MSRNSRGCGELFVHQSHRVASMLDGLYEDHPDGPSDQVSCVSVYVCVVDIVIIVSSPQSFPD